jgi:hypothetical protein
MDGIGLPGMRQGAVAAGRVPGITASSCCAATITLFFSFIEKELTLFPMIQPSESFGG